MRRTNALSLYFLSAKAMFYRLRADFAQELVVAVCAATVFATFSYVFQDFLHDKVKNISLSMHATFSKTAAYVLILLSTIANIRFLKPLLVGRDEVYQMGFRQGEQPKSLKTYLILRYLTFIFISYGLMWLVITRYLVSWDILKILLLQIASLFIVIAFSNFRSQIKNLSVQRNLLKVGKRGKLRTLFLWRVKQVLLRNRLTQLCVFVAVLFAGLSVYASLSRAPEVVSFLACLASGNFCAFSMTYQLQEDIKTAWSERCMGISHEEYLMGYLVSGLFLSSVIAIPVVVAHFSQTHTLFFAKLFSALVIPNYMVPFLMFQIDPRRPLIQIVILVILSLLIATATYVSLFALILLPLFQYYAAAMQAGRFYRV